MNSTQPLAPDLLKKYEYFSGMSDTALAELAKRIEVIDLPAGTVIVQQETPPDAFYFVRQGEVEVAKEIAPGKITRIAVISNGRGFGEVALLTYSHRSCSVTAKTAVTLYRLAKQDFDDIIIMDTAFMGALVKQAGSDARYNRIKNLKPFAMLEPEKMPALTEKLVEKRYPAGANIVNQGEPGDFYYIVKSGRVAVLVSDDGQTAPHQVAVLEEGDGFGEEALIRDHRRNATVQALEDVTVLALDKADFDSILKSSYVDYVYAEDFDELDAAALANYVFLDARIPPEYAEAHIENAINIPLEIVRQEYVNLDRSRKYVTYCTNDSRGMAAAFLLRSHGFNARNLRGGLSAWAGAVATGADNGIHLPNLAS